MRSFAICQNVSLRNTIDAPAKDSDSQIVSMFLKETSEDPANT